MKRFLTILALAATAGATAWADEARLLRFPATNGTEVAFSYAGDLWTVPVQGGEARRLTSHIGYEMFARYSPDGKSIAFTGEYDGNREVYLIPAKGGEPVRLTYTSTNERDDLGDRMGPNNIVMAWAPDGKSIVYRNRIGDGFPGKLWTVSPEGGMPAEVPLPEGGFCSYSPDGKKLAYNRVMREFRTWKYYRGGMADDVWVYDPVAGTVENVTNNDAQDIFPMWIGDEIFFASDRDMIMNIFVYNTRTKKTEKVTDFKEYDVKFPSTDGKTIVFENGGWLYRLDPKTRQSVKIPVTLASDDVYGRTERKAVADKLDGMSLSPDGSRMVVTARGEVFDIPAEKGVSRNISRSPGSNDRSADWSPDGKWIAWIGDATGETEIYLYDAVKGGDPVQVTDGADTYIRFLMWSPDSKHILYGDRKNRLVEVDPYAKTSRTLMQNPEAEFRTVEYSPDSKWLTYTRPAKNEMDIIYLYNIAERKEYPVTERWYNSGSPAFSADGKYLIFTSDRDLNPQYSNIEWNYAYGNMSGVYMAMLAKDTPSPLIATDPEVKVDADAPQKEAPKKEAPKKDTAKKAAPAPSGIDPEGIGDRIVKLPVKGRGFYCNDGKLWYSGGRGTRVFDFATGEDDDCADARMYIRNGDKKAVFMKGNDLYVAAPGPKVGLKDKVSLDGLVATIDYSQEWPQLFDEVWRAFRDGYYLENMHGRDWKGVKAKYEVLVPYAKTRLDLNYIIGEMISEVASGHAYVTAPDDYPKPERVPMGLLGAELSKVGDGFRIDHILQGATYREELRSPLQEPGLGVKEGDVITAIDGVSLKDVDNVYKLLVGKAGVLTELTINGKKVVVKPIYDEYPLYHYEWILKNIETVDKLSGGKVGYIYIPDMGPEGLNEWARYYYPQLDKEALIIDDRENGGGNISPMIIERLQRHAYRMTMRRGSTLTGRTPARRCSSSTSIPLPTATSSRGVSRPTTWALSSARAPGAASWASAAPCRIWTAPTSASRSSPTTTRKPVNGSWKTTAWTRTSSWTTTRSASSPARTNSC